MTDKAILLHGTGKRDTDRTWSAVISLETGNVTAGVSTPIRHFPCWGNAQPNLDALHERMALPNETCTMKRYVFAAALTAAV